MKKIKTFNQFISEDAAASINAIVDKEENRTNVNTNRGNTQPQNDKLLQDKIKKQKDLKVKELQTASKNIQDRQQTANQKMEEWKKRQAALRPENPNDAKNFDQNQKDELGTLRKEVDSTSSQTDFIKKQTDKIKKNF